LRLLERKSQRAQRALARCSLQLSIAGLERIPEGPGSQ
jgi:hypothetical protein